MVGRADYVALLRHADYAILFLRQARCSSWCSHPSLVAPPPFRVWNTSSLVLTAHCNKCSRILYGDTIRICAYYGGPAAATTLAAARPRMCCAPRAFCPWGAPSVAEELPVQDAAGPGAPRTAGW